MARGVQRHLPSREATAGLGAMAVVRAGRWASPLIWLLGAFLLSRAVGWTGLFGFSLGVFAAAPLEPGWLPLGVVATAAVALWPLAGAWVALVGAGCGAVLLGLRVVRVRPIWHDGALLLTAALWSLLVHVHMHTVTPGILLLTPIQGAVGVAVARSLRALRAAPGPESRLPAWIPWAVVIGAVASGAEGWHLGPVRASLSLLSGFALWMAEPGPEAAAPAAVAAALVGGIGGHLAGMQAAPVAVALGAAGFLGGVVSGRGLLTTLAGGLVAEVAVGWLLGGQIAPLIAGGLAGCVLVWAVRRWGPGVVRPAGLLAPASAQQRHHWAQRLREDAHALIEMSRHLAQQSGGPTDGLAWGDREGLALAEQVCPGCPAFTACWHRRPQRAQAMVTELWRAAREGNVLWQRVGGPDTIYCLRPREMADVANRLAAAARQEAEWARLLVASRRSAVEPLLGIGRNLVGLADELGIEPVAASADARPRSHGAPPRGEVLTVEHGGGARIARDWERVPSSRAWGFSATLVGTAAVAGAESGDTGRLWLVDANLLAMALADGMGSGPAAAASSAQALEHVATALTDGKSAEAALAWANGRLLGAGGRESFATIDLALVDLERGIAHICKMGAAPTYLQRGGTVRETPGGGLPAGVLDEVEIRSSTLRLRTGDLLVMISDGVLEPSPVGSGKRGRWIADWLRARPETSSPGQIAGGMVNEAQSRRGGGARDDVTTLACRLAGLVDGRAGRFTEASIARGGAPRPRWPT